MITYLIRSSNYPAAFTQNSKRLSLLTRFKPPSLQLDGRYVLQGDCLTPLTFNVYFNTFIRYISDKNFNQFGFTIGSPSPVHWFQFADDAAVIICLENENQILLNHFARWCTWANMIIRVDKRSTFGIKKASTSSVQYLPKLILNHDSIPTVEIGKSFTYLGRCFYISMNKHNHLADILSLVTNLIKQINGIPCHLKNKLLLYHRFVPSKLSWNLTIENIGKIWVVENIDNLFASYFRQWFELPIRATLSTLILPKSKYGINCILPSITFSDVAGSQREYIEKYCVISVICLIKTDS